MQRNEFHSGVSLFHPGGGQRNRASASRRNSQASEPAALEGRRGSAARLSWFLTSVLCCRRLATASGAASGGGTGTRSEPVTDAKSAAVVRDTVSDQRRSPTSRERWSRCNRPHILGSHIPDVFPPVARRSRTRQVRRKRIEGRPRWRGADPRRWRLSQSRAGDSGGTRYQRYEWCCQVWSAGAGAGAAGAGVLVVGVAGAGAGAVVDALVAEPVILL